MNGSDNVRNTSEQTEQDDREAFRTVIELEPSGDDAWKATEPKGKQDVYGRGDNPREAVKNYVEVLD